MNELQRVKGTRALSVLTATGLIVIVLALMPRVVHAHQGADAITAASSQALAGLQLAEQDCGPGGYLIVGTDICSHGPDTPPTDEELEEAKLALNDVGVPITTVCIGDGVSGKRVQVLYVIPSDKTDRYDASLKMIRTIATNVGFFFEASARITNGNRLVYFVTTPACEIDVERVEVADTADDNLSATVQALTALGYDSPDRKYLIFMESDVYCGISTVIHDTQPGPENISNSRPGYARVDRNCWNEIAATHELVHTLGGVQLDAPNSTGAWHCTDEKDIMCYSDAPYYPTVRTVCSDVSYGQLLDCNNDDYFNTNPTAGSYLATHWNVANSQFLINFDNLASNANITLTVTDTTASDYRLFLNIVDGAELAPLLDHVEFFVDDELVGTDSDDVFEAVWPEPTPGVHVVKAKIYFSGGSRVVQELRVTVPQPALESSVLYLPLVRSAE